MCLPLRFGLLPEEKREIAARYLVDDIVNKRKGHLSTGVFWASGI